MSTSEETERRQPSEAGASGSAAAPAAPAAANIHSDGEPITRLRRLSLPGDMAGIRHYHMHEHHYYVWNNCSSHGGCCGDSHKWVSPMWQPWQGRHYQRACPSYSSGAWAPPWVFGRFPWNNQGGRFSVMGSVVVVLLWLMCRGAIWLVRVHRRPPQLE